LSFDLHPAEFLYLDLFPAVVTELTDDVALGDELRVVVTENYLYVLRDTPDGPEMLTQEATRDFSGTNKTGYTIETVFNRYYVKRAPNCGCGASLRGIHLFPSAVYKPPTS
jgi:hypothetical protein